MNKDVARVTYTTSLNPELIKEFKIYCAVNGKYQNEVLEQLIKEFLTKEGVGIGDTNK